MSILTLHDRPDLAQTAATRQFSFARVFPWALTAAFLFTGIARIIFHVPWRDELEDWMIGRYSDSLAALVHNLQLQGRTFSWYLCMFALNRFTHSLLAMKLLHITLASAVIFIVARYSPFSMWQKVLFTLGYFPFFEYAIISRYVVLGVLGTFAACAVFCSKKSRPITLAIVLALTMQSSIHGVIVACAFILAAGHRIWTRRHIERPALGRLAIALGICTASLLLAAIQLKPASQSGLQHPWQNQPFEVWFIDALCVVWRGCVPIFGNIPNFWNSNILEPNHWIMGAMSLLLMQGIVVLFAQRRTALLLVGSGSVAIMLLAYLCYYGQTRHHGHVFLLLVCACWIAMAQRDDVAPSPRVARRDALRNGALTALLGLHACLGVTAAYLDLHQPFSASVACADYVADHFDRSMPIAADFDYSAQAVAARLDRPMYYLRRRQWGRFVVWDHLRKRPATGAELVAEAQDFADGLGHDVLLLMNYPSPQAAASFGRVASFTDSTIETECYWLYRVKPRNQMAKNTVPLISSPQALAQ